MLLKKLGLPVIIPMLLSPKILHIEPTDVCQLACPLCARETDPVFNKAIKHHLTVNQIKDKFNVEFIQQLDKMFMCGNYGDPSAGAHTIDIYNYFRDINPTITLGMNTNGGLQTKHWWTQLGGLLDRPRDYVVFSIDGLEDTNHIYRKNSNWGKLIENATAFINAGGRAHWDMLVYAHNQHQVDQCEQLAKSMGFTWFRAKISKRPYVNGLEFPIGWQDPIQKTGPIQCIALQEQSTYIDAQGRISPCCWLGGTHTDFVTLGEVSATWDNDPHPVCQATCSGSNNSFTNQWQREVQLC